MTAFVLFHIAVKMKSIKGLYQSPERVYFPGMTSYHRRCYSSEPVRAGLDEGGVVNKSRMREASYVKYICVA